jgi:hypothetical protein
VFKTAAQEWEEFWKAVAPPRASAIQKQEMRRAFYAGIYCMLQTCKALGHEDVPEDDGVEVLEKLQEELEAFYELMKKGVN